MPKPGTEIAENDVGDKIDSDFTAKADTGEVDTKVVVKTVIADMEKNENQVSRCFFFFPFFFLFECPELPLLFYR